MIHLHLTKFWFNEIKYGNKVCEYRRVTPRLRSLISRELASPNPLTVRLYCGYPKSTDIERIMTFFIRDINIVEGSQLNTRVKRFFDAPSDALFYQFVLGEVCHEE